MKSFLFAAVLAPLAVGSAWAQTEAKLPDLPAPASEQPAMPKLPAPASTYDPVPEAALNPAPAPRQMSKEEIERLKQDENWLVEGMRKKQEQDAAAQLAKKAADAEQKKEPAKESTFQPGELSGFKPVLANSSLSSLNVNQPDANTPASKKKNNSQTLTPLDSSVSGSNPLRTSPTDVVQPILGPSRQPQTNANVANLNPGMSVTPLPSTGIKKISSNPNFIPDGYADSWTKQQHNPYQPVTPMTAKPLPPAAPAVPRPTFKDLANTIPDPTQIR